ncbi:DsrE family protein [Candidatus Gottesmanbacteria bacterium]|nr:DsrE family protein [Candidatus Gottesmanbacteria bacterium]
MKLGIIIYSNDPETIWNAFRFANHARKENEQVSIFLLGKGVESETIVSVKFNVVEQMRIFVESQGKIYACGICLKIREKGSSDLCSLSSMSDLYRLVKESDTVISF